MAVRPQHARIQAAERLADVDVQRGVQVQVQVDVNVNVDV
jgi:hypothetical protein